MTDANLVRVERAVVQCRLILSFAGPLTVYLDPTEPTLMRTMGGAAFSIHPYALAVMVGHLCYSVVLYVALVHAGVPARRIANISVAGDVLFGTAVALMTEGHNSPFFLYFAFAVLAAGMRGTFRTTLMVTATSVGLYLALVLLARPAGLGFYLMRGLYMAITGYLVGFLGRQRIVLETNLTGLVRSLHDGYAQALAGVNLRVGTCRELLRRGRGDDALAELTDLQTGVTREYDHLRAYIRSLVGLDATAPRPPAAPDHTRFSVRVQFDAPLAMVEHALQIMIEGSRNVGRHASAGAAVLSATASGEKVVIRIDDDGVGFAPNADIPWSIASRAAELGGQVRIAGGGPGGHVVVELPNP
jgi:signal transduction histidine kinase